MSRRIRRFSLGSFRPYRMQGSEGLGEVRAIRIERQRGVRAHNDDDVVGCWTRLWTVIRTVICNLISD